MAGGKLAGLLQLVGMNQLRPQIRRLRSLLEKAIAAQDAGLLRDRPVSDFLAFFDSLPLGVGYARVPEQAESFLKSIAERAGSAALEDFNKLALLVLMEQFEVRSATRRLTPPVRREFMRYFESLLAAMEKPRRGYYLITKDAYLKDLAVCRMKLWPCGAELADEYSGVPRSLLVRGGFRQLVSGLPFFLLKARGFKPFFETHFDPRLIEHFTPEGYRRLYCTIAELLETNPQVKGMMGSSWWHDPALEAISPELWFLTKEPLLGGAKLLRVGQDSTAARDATRFSLTRKRLREAGRYDPTVFMLVWLRDDLILWASSKR